jgi:potassium-transporting ATPase KdpC subunit
MSFLRPALTLLALLSVLTGLVYPLVVTGVAQVLFPAQAAGSLVVRDGQPIGSTLIGQPFAGAGYFWGRLSATAPFPYNAAASSGSNYGPQSKNLRAATAARIDALRAAVPGSDAAVPADLATGSGSGLDPDCSPDAARWQVPRVARVRGLDPARVQALVDAHTHGRQLGVLGEPRVNVLALNLALDAATAKP